MQFLILYSNIFQLYPLLSIIHQFVRYHYYNRNSYKLVEISQNYIGS